MRLFFLVTRAAPLRYRRAPFFYLPFYRLHPLVGCLPLPFLLKLTSGLPGSRSLTLFIPRPFLSRPGVVCWSYSPPLNPLSFTRLYCRSLSSSASPSVVPEAFERTALRSSGEHTPPLTDDSLSSSFLHTTCRSFLMTIAVPLFFFNSVFREFHFGITGLSCRRLFTQPGLSSRLVGCRYHSPAVAFF